MNDAQEHAARRVVHTALRTVRGGINERAGYNNCMVTKWWQARFGWGVGQPWCAMTVSMIGYDAHVMDFQDFSAGAWALNDHLHSKGLGLSNPEPGCIVTYKWGTGHIEVVVKVLGGGYVVTVGGNTGGSNPAEGDGCKLVRRYLPGSTVAHPFARFPGVQHGWPRLGHIPDWYDQLLFNRQPSSLIKKHGTAIVQRAVGVSDDGAYGPNTADHVRQLQRKHGLIPDGAIHTREALLVAK